MIQILAFLIIAAPLALKDKRQFVDVEICQLNTLECQIKQVEVKRDEYGNLSNETIKALL